MVVCRRCRHGEGDHVGRTEELVLRYIGSALRDFRVHMMACGQDLAAKAGEPLHDGSADGAGTDDIRGKRGERPAFEPSERIVVHVLLADRSLAVPEGHEHEHEREVGDRIRRIARIADHGAETCSSIEADMVHADGAGDRHMHATACNLGEELLAVAALVCPKASAASAPSSTSRWSGRRPHSSVSASTKGSFSTRWNASASSGLT